MLIPAVWSWSTLFAQTCLFEYLGEKMYVCFRFQLWKKLGMVGRHYYLFFLKFYMEFMEIVKFMPFCSIFTIKCSELGQKPRYGRETWNSHIIFLFGLGIISDWGFYVRLSYHNALVVKKRTMKCMHMMKNREGLMYYPPPHVWGRARNSRANVQGHNLLIVPAVWGKC